MLREEFEEEGVEVDKFPRVRSGTAGFGMLEEVVGDCRRISLVAQLMFGLDFVGLANRVLKQLGRSYLLW